MVRRVSLLASVTIACVLATGGLALALKYITGTSGNDVLSGTSADDHISALAGDDRVMGLGGPDSIDGSAGNDVLRGESDARIQLRFCCDDWIEGGSGNDTIHGDGGADHLFGDDGEFNPSGIAPGADTIYGSGGHDYIEGGRGSDLLSGGLDDDTIWAADGGTRDTVDCGSGFDIAHVDTADRFAGGTPAAAGCEVVDLV